MNGLFSSIRPSRYKPDVIMAAHVHDDTSFSLVLSGSYEETIRGRSDTYGAGALLVCPPDELHAQRFGQGGVYKLVFSPTADALGRLGEVARLAEAPIVCSAAVADVGRRIMAELRRADDFSPLIIEGLSHELLGLFARGQATSTSLPRFLKTAIDYLHDAKGAQITLDQLAAVIGCDAGRLSAAFRRHLGCTVGDYQRRLRVEQAAGLLATGRLPIAEIAVLCGFADQPHLNRAFKAQIGTTPAAYRRDRH
jgi:AraC family transcriptional regulator